MSIDDTRFEPFCKKHNREKALVTSKEYYCPNCEQEASDELAKDCTNKRLACGQCYRAQRCLFEGIGNRN